MQADHSGRARRRGASDDEPGESGSTSSHHHDRSPAELDALVRRGLPIVRGIVAEVAARVPRHVRRDELMSAGLLGLTQAALSWEPDRGVPFEHYARIRVRGSVVDELRSLDWASRSVRSSARRMQSTEQELSTELGHSPSASEVANRMGCELSEVEQLRQDLSRAMVMRFEGAEGGSERTLADATTDGPDAVVLDRELRGYLQDAVIALPERLRHVIVGYFFDGREMQDIAAELGVTPSRVSQLAAEALALLRDGINASLDPDRVVDLHQTKGRVARRKAAYYSAVAEASSHRSRLESDHHSVIDLLERRKYA